MCGIVGLLGAEIDPERLQRASKQLTHRGPDDDGVFVGEGFGLAARRLSIIDLQGGHQPLSNEDGTVWVACNGEILNAPRLRRQLIERGHRFRSRVDTEVLVHAYEAWGAKAVTRLRGMFAFALWDARRRRLILARDRLGIKPLFYAQEGQQFAFSSEARSLFWLLPRLPRRADLHALRHIFELGWAPTPRTPFETIRALPAGHTLVLEGGKQRTVRYWSIEFPRKGQHRDLSLDEAVSGFQAMLTSTVDAWRTSDVPVGALLSGGLDSSALVTLLTELTGRAIDTFSIGFSAQSHDEAAYARRVADHIGSHHHQLHFDVSSFNRWPDVVAFMGTPQCSATSVPIFLLYEACHEAGYKVIMTGEGADELLGGYHWFDGDRRVRRYLGWPAWIRQLVAALPLPVSAAGRRVLALGARQRSVQRYALWQQLARRGCLAQLFQDSVWSQVQTPADETDFEARARRELGRWLDGREPFDQFLLLEAATRLVDFINHEVDHMSMANSVEARPPFLDHRLWEFCAQLPPAYKLNGAGSKRLLRLTMSSKLPKAIVSRPKKGLAAPHADWWRATKLPPWATEALHPTALGQTGYFNPDAVRRWQQRHQDGHHHYGSLLTGVLTTQLWHDRVLHG